MGQPGWANLRLPVMWLAGLAFAGGVSAQPYFVQWMPADNPPAVEANGFSPAMVVALERERRTDTQWAALFAVYAEQPSGNAIPAMGGSWRISDGRLRFEPTFSLERGLRYRAELRPPGSDPVVSFFELPADTSPPTTIVMQVFPGADVLPENQLKFYIQFSAPMSRGGTYEHIHIRNNAGAVIELPFLELDEELWDPPMTRLTLLIDPGRIKRGVKPLEDIGPVFEVGKNFALTIDAACVDAAGKPLRAPFEKRFRVGPADRSPPDPARWKITAPAAGSRDALVVEFDEPMDHALALRLIGVAAKAAVGAMLDGDVSLENDDRRWRFVPVKPWTRGAHWLTVATTIEDLAGNNIGKPFDVDLFDGVERRISTRSVGIDFEVK